MRVLLAAIVLLGASRAYAQDVSPEQAVLVTETPSEPIATPEPTEADRVFEAQEAERLRLRPFHIVFGNLTWAASNLATLFGFLHFSDRFGWDGNPTHTGCAWGDPIFDDYCAPGTVPLPHAIAVTALTIFYGSAFTIGSVMPDPFEVGSGHNDLAVRIQIHRALRWTSLAILLAQIVLGAVSANVDFGSDFAADRALAATHLALGSLSWGVITAQGVVGSLLAY